MEDLRPFFLDKGLLLGINLFSILYIFYAILQRLVLKKLDINFETSKKVFYSGDTGYCGVFKEIG